MSKRIVFTGLGVMAANGKGREEYWRALREGRAGFRPVTLFDSSEFRVHQAGDVPDFDPKVYMGPKGLRTLDRATMLLVSAAKLAKEDAGITITDENTTEIGVVTGTTFGSLNSVVDFDTVTLRDGPRYTNPALFPNTVMNSPSSQVAIWHHIEGFNTTIANGFTAGFDAVKYGYDFLQWDRAKVVFAGAIEEMCLPTFLGFHNVGFLSGAKEGQEVISCPFDRRRNGVIFGEGACSMVMEDSEQAVKRGARILGEVVAFGYCFDPFRLARYNFRPDALVAAIKEALDNAGMGLKDIDYICANANSSVAADRLEGLALKEVFGEYRKKVPVSSIKSMVGESYSASGALALAAALGSVSEDFIPPNVNYQEPDPEIDLNVMTEPVKTSVQNVMVINFAPSGAQECIILRKFKA